MLDESVEFGSECLALVGAYGSRSVSCSSQGTVTAGTGVPGLHYGFHKFGGRRSAFERDLGELCQRHQRDELVEISSIQRNDWDVWFHVEILGG